LPRHPARRHLVAGSRPRARRHHYWIWAALAALALASPLAIAAAPAAAQGIQFNSVSGDGSGDLTVTVTSDYPLTDWTLSLSNANGTYTLDDFTDFTDTSAPFTPGVQQVYVLNAAAAQQDLETTLALPLGDYQVTATSATATDGTNVETLPSPQTITNGTFSFLAQPTLTINGSTFNTTEQNQFVTINGQITGCTTTTLVCPTSWSGTSVAVTNVTAPSKPWTATADSTGDFSVTGVTGVPNDYYSVSVPAVPGVSLAATATTQDVPQYAQTSIMATAKPAAYGKQSVTGQLTYEPEAGGFNKDAPLGVSITAASGAHKVSTTTGSDGEFSLALPAITGTTTWLISSQANDLGSSPFLQATESSVTATQLWPVKISFSASLDKYGYLTVAGCMSPTLSQRPPADDPTMAVQWRSGRTGRWLTLGYLSTMEGEGCAGFGFYGSHPAPAPSAYYRAYFPGDNVYAPAASASTARVWSYPTRFQAFRANPRSVKAGHKVTISGTLQYQAGSKWPSYGNEPVVILYAPTRSAETWFYGGSVTTNSKGAFSWTFTDTSSDYWKAYYAGDDRHFVASARPIPVRVHGGASSTRVPLGEPVSLPSAGLSARGSMWPFVLSADPWLVLMGD
jgi:hypothetical protein